MLNQHKISEFIDNISFKKTIGGGFRPDDVYDSICQLTSMYNEVLAASYKENEELKKRLASQSPDIDSRLIQYLNSDTDGEQAEVVEDNFISELDFTTEIDNSFDIRGNISFEPEQEDESLDKTGERAEASIEPRKNIIKNSNVKTEQKVIEGEECSMTEKELQRLRRSELLELLLEQSKENERLKSRISMLDEEVDELTGKLEDRSIKIEKAGTLAEASLLINGVIESAQAAAQQYLDNLQQLSEREEINCVKKEAETEEYVKRMLADAQKQCDAMLKNAEDRCSAMTYVTQQQCSSMRDDATAFCRKLEEETKKKCEELEAFTRKKCEVKEKQTEERCANLDQKTQQDTAKCWDDMTKRMDEFYKVQEYLRNMFGGAGQSPNN